MYHKTRFLPTGLATRYIGALIFQNWAHHTIDLELEDPAVIRVVAACPPKSGLWCVLSGDFVLCHTVGYT